METKQADCAYRSEKPPSLEKALDVWYQDQSNNSLGNFDPW